MRSRRVLAGLSLGAAVSCATGLPQAPAPPAPDRIVLQAPLFDALGSYRRDEVSTRVPLARSFFDQGLLLAYGFNHAEAERSFREAARLDPTCAICWWGAALVLGPNINVPMDPEANPRALEALAKARALIDHADATEAGLIEALGRRYAETAGEDRSALDAAYAEAMRELAARFPRDPDVSALFAEAVMDEHPWAYADTQLTASRL